ncbi:GAF and ANTAR domain-containing protein [Saccharothrix sp. S26]|uniref:GAF and ANTAR domain-containing protein n=1 Tax=Saccharothrix sp. S26 TaxID=2907215 RepID=UPI001F451849|nr:GAF and ANTAR domain-containing protein [Saccharothrix sp. S26]MCE6997315.1 GAF and ANTAR domain-containing protein [Saccharothrix sp. S26]
MANDVDGVLRRLDVVTSALADLTQVLADEEDLSAIMDRVCRQVVGAIPDADLASVTVLRDGAAESLAWTDEHTLAVDRAQYEAGEGPCLEAAESRQFQRVAVGEAAERWPAFAEAATRLGIGSYLSAPLLLDEQYHGSLNLYGRQTHGFRELDAALLGLYTTAAEAALGNARRYLRARRQVDQLHEAMESRAVIDQAKGIVMAVHRVSADEAFTMLVDRSQEENRKLRDLAEHFVDEATRPES